jgi:hypothetical protein
MPCLHVFGRCKYCDQSIFPIRRFACGLRDGLAGGRVWQLLVESSTVSCHKSQVLIFLSQFTFTLAFIYLVSCFFFLRTDTHNMVQPEQYHALTTTCHQANAMLLYTSFGVSMQPDAHAGKELDTYKRVEHIEHHMHAWK